MVGWDVVASNSEGRYGQIEMLIRPMCEFKKEAREQLTRSSSLFMVVLLLSLPPCLHFFVFLPFKSGRKREAHSAFHCQGRIQTHGFSQCEKSANLILEMREKGEHTLA